MAKPARSPLLGYNHNVRYGGHIFHVQTEDSGPGNPHLFTHLFFEGSILASKRTDYAPETPDDNVRGLMQGQHKAILKDLKQGTFDERIVRFFGLRGETFQAHVAQSPGGAVEPAPPPTAPVPEISGDVPTVPPTVPPSEALAQTPEPEPSLGMAAQPQPPPSAQASPEEDISVHSSGASPADDPAASAPVVVLAEDTLPLAGDHPPPSVEMPAAETPTDPSVLDLDAVATPPVEPTVTPEPLPIHATQPVVPGPGTYTMRRPVREEVLDPEPRSRTSPIGRPGAARPVTPVVVQRQVVVGAGGGPVTGPRKPSTTPVRRRPVSGGPYVVKEGSHADIVGATANRKAAPPARPEAPDAEAARTAETPRPSTEAAPNVLVTDQSLDDVILAYLSQGDRKG